jgi:hypothetical protein
MGPMGPMNPKLRRFLDREFTIAELIGVALMFAAPYLVVGLIWSSLNTGRLDGLGFLDRVFAFFGAIVTWPVLWVSNICVP